MKTPFHKLNNFPRLERQLAPLVADMMELPVEDRRTESKKILDKFNILVDDKFEWCIWHNDKDYTMFILRWS
jgi:hypothetical protein